MEFKMVWFLYNWRWFKKNASFLKNKSFSMFLDVKNIKIRRLGKKNKLGRHL